MADLLELTGRAEAAHFWFRGFREFVTPVLEELAAGRRDLRLLDCGCGTGYNLSLLRPHGHAFGFDLSQSGLSRVHEFHGRLVRADVTRIPFASGSVDIATSFDVLQCVDDDEAAVAEMARVVRPGGAVVLTVAALEVLRGDHAEVWREVRRYTPGSVGRLVGGAGLRVERVQFMFGSLFPLMLGVRVAQRLTRPFRRVSLDSDIGVPSPAVNAALSWLVRTEARVARRVNTPVGSSLLVLARRGPT